MDALEAIRARRSAGRLVDPGPTDGELGTILEAAACAPDHGELRPFRFTVLRDTGMDAFGKVLADAYRARCAADEREPVPAKAGKELTKLRRAPLVVVVTAVRATTGAIPWVEQLAACAAACQNALLAATALGYGSMWRTGEPCYDARVKAALGRRDDDAVVAFLYFGTLPESSRVVKGPKQPNLEGLVEQWPT